jgi:tRNA(Ile)-lysidine synthase
MSKLLHLDRLQEGKVLLAFSGGVDSTALFHLLLENTISFDIAHVNYHTRPSSDAEALSGELLAQSHGIHCHSHSCHLDGSNFEHRAREERYAFFEHLIHKYDYTYLLTAHQLNDRLEWMLMQICKGSGLPELLGIKSIDRRGAITIIRPLLDFSREEIESYLETHNLPHFIDESNSDEKYTRNRFRQQFSTPLMHLHADAIRRSFRYLEEDTDTLIEDIYFHQCGDLYYTNNSANIRSLVYAIDKVFKTLGILINGEIKENLKREKSCVIARQYVVSIDTDHTFIAPYHPNTVMDKGFREECRKLKIEPKLRGFLYGSPAAWELMRQLKGLPKPLQCG